MRIFDKATCLDPYLASFEQSFSARNYKPATLENYRYHLRCFGRLLDVEGIAPSALTADIAVELGRRLPTTPKAQIKVANLAGLFVEHLIEIGVATRPSLTAAQAERQELLGDLETYLERQRGLSPRSVKHVLGFAARFLAHRFGDQMLDLAILNARDVVAFMEHVIGRKTPYRDKTLSSHLRSFFQYLFAQGLIPTNLSLCVPRVHKPWGARLGMRAPEVMAVQLDDIDWRAGELLVRGKGKRHDRLPIPSDVGEAISRYLREERTSTTTRTLFVSHRAPTRPFKDSQIINSILREAFAATGVKPPTPYVGSHVLRHSLATNLVRSGASLEEIGDLLRHRSRATTMIYAKLDTDGLRSIAQPWPIAEVAR